MDGNVCIKTLMEDQEPLWWWALYQDTLFDSLTANCFISGCDAIQVKQTAPAESEWVDGAFIQLESAACQFAMASAVNGEWISIDIRITSTSGHTIEATSVVKRAESYKE